MTLSVFKSSLSQKSAPENMSPLLKSLWHDGKGEWEAAHDIAQHVHSTGGALVHAYLHRKEGDLSNAGYWYRKAGRALPETSFAQEWEDLITEFIDKDDLTK